MNEDGTTPAERRPWWKTGYGKVVAVMGFIGLVFALAQLPVTLSGFPETVKESINVMGNLFSEDKIVTAGRIGNFHVDRGVAEAVSAFGSPDSKTGGRLSVSCTLRWEAKGIEMLVVSPIGEACTRGFFCEAKLTSHRWKTTKGLHVGDSLGRLHSLYPNAGRGSPAGFQQQWVLDAGTLPCTSGDDETSPQGLQAVTIGTNVDHFELFYLGIGE